MLEMDIESKRCWDLVFNPCCISTHHFFPPSLAIQLGCLESLRSASGKVWVRDEVGVGEGILGVVSRQLQLSWFVILARARKEEAWWDLPPSHYRHSAPCTQPCRGLQ